MAGLLLADVWLVHLAPGLSGRHLVLLAGSVLAALVSPGTAASALPLVIGVMAGNSVAVLEGAWVVACGLVTLWAGSLVVKSPGFSLLGASASVVGGLLAGLWRSQYRAGRRGPGGELAGHRRPAD